MTEGPNLPEDFGNPWMSNLEEIDLPEPVPFTFESPGWYLLLALVLGIVAWLLWRGWKRWLGNAYRRSALEELAANESPARLSELLKRVALVAYPRTNVASLYGEAWLDFLDQTLGTTDFTHGSGRPLADLTYDPSAESRLSRRQKQDLLALSRRWVRRHRHA